MNYEIMRSRRTTLALTVDRNGRVVVRAPKNYPEDKIHEFVMSKSDWVEKHSLEALEKRLERGRRLSLPPERLPFLGELCPVDHAQPYGYSDGCFHLPKNTPLEALLPFLRKVYLSIARDTLISRTTLLADRMNVKINTVKINSAKTRWGSCSANRTINLSWKLIAADLHQIDYVIVHELCHIGQMNHSPAFWAKVGAVIPDYHERREALKETQKILSEYGLDL